MDIDQDFQSSFYNKDTDGSRSTGIHKLASTSHLSDRLASWGALFRGSVDGIFVLKLFDIV